jgi:hypothetical protein
MFGVFGLVYTMTISYFGMEGAELLLLAVCILYSVFVPLQLRTNSRRLEAGPMDRICRQ